MIDLIAFDADDTLWHNEPFYRTTQEKFKKLLSAYLDEREIEGRLFQTEMRNLEPFGYGIKAFTLSMIETAVELTGGQVKASEIQQIVGYAHEMVNAEVRLLDGVPEVLAALSKSYPLMILTKGDPLDQERKLRRSGLAPYFKYFEILSDKTPHGYAVTLHKLRIQSECLLMVGNSLRSDILPIVEIGGIAVYIPYPLTWDHEIAPLPENDRNSYTTLDNIRLLPELIARLSPD
ncbi:MAG: HAD family hydrolase [Chloroflexi bacterium]|nr:HAD family hydrolase [Chloroflexota bacterium]